MTTSAEHSNDITIHPYPIQGISWNGTELDTFITSVSVKAGQQQIAQIEERIRALIQPKPRWLPRRIWNRILRRVLMLEVSAQSGSSAIQG